MTYPPKGRSLRLRPTLCWRKVIHNGYRKGICQPTPKTLTESTLSSSGPFLRIEVWPSPRIEAWPSPRIEACPSPRIEAWLLQGSKPGLLQGYLVLGIITITTILFFDLHQSLVMPVFAQLTDLNDLIRKYNIHLDFHPRLPPPGVVVSELPNNRHADSVITHPKPHTGSYDDSEVRRLSAFVMKLCDMPNGILVLPGLIRVWKSLTCDPILRGFDGNVIGFGQCRKKYKKRKTSTSIQVAKRTRLATTHAASGSAKKNLCNKLSDDGVCKVGEQNDEQDDDCVEILLITPIRFATKLPFGVNQGDENFDLFATEGLRRKGARTKDIVDGRVDTPSKNVARPYSSAGTDLFVVGPSSVSSGTSSNNIERDFIPFVPGPYYADYT
ncbi:hypothetical protein Tco_1319969 [Tanacetum coccineum]